MDYISAKETAANWGISQRRVIYLANEGRISGAKLFGTNWMIPKDAEKPLDGRTKQAKNSDEHDSFRFPFFVNKKESDFVPPLSYEERELRLGQIDFYACRIEEAKKHLLPLSEHATNRYVRITALYHRCFLAIFENNDDFDTCFGLFELALAENFPHKKEMMFLRYWLDFDLGYFKSILEDFRIDPTYSYSSEALDMMAPITLIATTGGDYALLSKIHYEHYEICCRKMEHEGHYLEAQALHYALIEIYQMQANKEMIRYHLHRGLEIAFEHKLYFRPAMCSFYYPTITRAALSEFPKDFAQKIISTGIDFHNNYVHFQSDRTDKSYLSQLTDKEFVYVTFAVQGYSNKEIAKIQGLSEKTISKRYNEIYEKLGIKSKRELTDLVSTTQSSGAIG